MASSRILLIGMAPGHGDPSKPLEGRIGRRIAALAGIEFETYLSRTQRVNLIEQDVPSTMPWPAKEARARAEKLLHLFSHRLVLLLGRRVAEAFGVGQQPYFLPTRILSTGAVVVVPHPSGLNRWWNDPRNAEKARDLLTDMLGDRESTGRGFHLGITDDPRSV